MSVKEIAGAAPVIRGVEMRVKKREVVVGMLGSDDARWPSHGTVLRRLT